MDDKLEREYLEYERQGRIWGNVPRERIRKIKFPRIGKHIIDQFLLLDDLTATISDVLDKEFIRMATRDLYYLAEEGDVAIADLEAIWKSPTWADNPSQSPSHVVLRVRS